MSGKIYLAFINHPTEFPWDNLVVDLKKCVPLPFEKLQVDIDLELYYSRDRGQYYSTLLLTHLLKILPEDGEKIVGIVDVDIFIPILTFLFGEAQFKGKGALVSTYRLRNEFYGLPANDFLLYQRLLKEVLHELGHTLGLVHCRDFECVMNSSTYVEDIDLKHARLCTNCQKILGVDCKNKK
ncbi:MAG: hypothetical protein Kow0037_29990 [Calditrichia bacterium]